MPHLDADTNQIRGHQPSPRGQPGRHEPQGAHEARPDRQPRHAYLAAGTTFRADCDGRCVWAASSAVLGDLTRLLTYHDQYGYQGETLRLYAELAKADRDWKGADLDASCNACPNHLDCASLPPWIDHDLA